MVAPTVIKSLEVEVLDLPLRVPFGISGGVQSMANNVLVTVMLADGTYGHGEAAPLPAYNGETQVQALNVLAEAGTAMRGHDAADWRALAREFRRAGGAGCGAAQAAFETAVLDALTRQRAEPLWKCFGGAGTELETGMTVTTGSPAEAVDGVRDIHRRGIRLIKVKIGGRVGVKHDLARILAIHEEAPDAPLILDGNAGLTRGEALALVRGLKAAGIAPALLEQWLPKDDLVGMRTLGAESGWPVAADESVTTPLEALQVVHTGAAQVINVKLMKAGVAAALDIVGIVRASGLGLMIGGNVESILAMTTSACFAAGLGGFRFSDLDTPLFIADHPFVGGYEINGGHLSVAHIVAGHGVVPVSAHD